jgi:hypothetical protein
MPNQRATGQTLIGCHLDADFVAEIDAARGVRTRSQFLRDALFFYLCEKCGRRIPDSWRYAPDRAGKGGRPRKVVQEPKAAEPVDPDRQYLLNDKEKPLDVGRACACEYPKPNRKKKS